MADSGQKWAGSSNKPTSKPNSIPSGPLPNKPGETIGKSIPPWPVGDFPPFRDSESKPQSRENPGKPLRK